MKTRSLLVVTLLALAVMPGMALMGSMLPGVLDVFDRAAVQSGEARARSQAAELTQRLERRKETVRNIAKLPAPLEMVRAAAGTNGDTTGGLYLGSSQAAERFSAVMDRWFGEASDLRTLVVTGPGGEELLRLEPSASGLLAAAPQDPWSDLLADLRGGGGPCDLRAEIFGEAPQLRLASRIACETPQVPGALVMDFDLQDVLKGYDESLWVDGRGRYLRGGAFSDGAAWQDFPQLQRAEGALLWRGDADGVADIAWVPLALDARAGNVLWIGTPVDHSHLMAWLNELKVRSIVVGLVLVVVVLAVVMRLTGWFDTLRARLVDGLHRMIDGAEDVRFAWGGPAEARKLADDLNELTRLHVAANAARRAAEADLQHEKEQAEITLHSIADGVLTTDASGHVRFVNPAAQRLLHVSVDEAVGQALDHLFGLVGADPAQPPADPVRACLRADAPVHLPDDAMLVRRDGSSVAVEAVAAPMHGGNGAIDGAVLVVRDVSRERRLRELLVHQANHDALTGLTNRAAFEVMLRQALFASRRDGEPDHWLCYVDLDQFKLINDTCGHLAGDEMLKQVAVELLAEAREQDVVARVSGDEFAVLMRRCGRDLAYEVTERMRRRVADMRFAWEDQSFATSGSFGLVPVRAGAGSLYDLLSAADAACYVAKDRGRNRIHLADTADEAVERFGGEMRWAHETLRALEENRFTLYAQEIRDLRPGAAPHLHVEILVRMRDAAGAIVPPGAFIPAAERYNMMRDVDRWVLHHTFRAFAHRSAADTVVAVNLSAQSLCDDDFLGFVLAEIDVTGIDSAMLCFEVTETAAMSNLSRAQEVITALKARHCTFSLDDFGSGLSSFGYLKNLPVDYLKIDGAFVRNIETDPLDHAFVRSINGIGHLMGIRTVAEYVENPAIEQMLREIGVDYAQGYAVARPVPLEEVLGRYEAAEHA